MDQDKRTAVALMRYSAIAPLITGTQDEYVSLRAYYRDAAARGIKDQDGQIRYYSPAQSRNGTLPTKMPDLTGFFLQDGRTAASAGRSMPILRKRSGI